MTTILAPRVDPKFGPRLAQQLMLLRVMSFMLWPKKEHREKRKACIKPLSLARMDEILQQQAVTKDESIGAKSNNRHRKFQSGILKAFEHQWFPEFMRTAKGPLAGYATTALVAYYLIGLQLSDHARAIVKPSVGLAAAIVAEVRGVKRMNGTTLVQQHVKGIVAKWGKHKAVAHFWAAYLVMKLEDPAVDPLSNFTRFIGLSTYFSGVLQNVQRINSKDLIHLPKEYRYEPIVHVVTLDQDVIDMLPRYKSDGGVGSRFCEAPSGQS